MSGRLDNSSTKYRVLVHEVIMSYDGIIIQVMANRIPIGKNRYNKYTYRIMENVGVVYDAIVVDLKTLNGGSGYLVNGIGNDIVEEDLVRIKDLCIKHVVRSISMV